MWVEGVTEAHLDDKNAFLAVLTVTSFYMMWAAGTICDRTDSCKDELGWALTVGIVSFVVCVVLSICEVSYRGEGEGAAEDPRMKNAHTLASIAFVLWWFVAVLVCTFEKPFKSACSIGDAYGSPNGFFSTWISLAASLRYMTLSLDPSLLKKANLSLIGTGAGALVVFALILILQTLWDTNDTGNGLTSVQNWGLSC